VPWNERQVGIALSSRLGALFILRKRCAVMNRARRADRDTREGRREFRWG